MKIHELLEDFKDNNKTITVKDASDYINSEHIYNSKNEVIRKHGFNTVRSWTIIADALFINIQSQF